MSEVDEKVDGLPDTSIRKQNQDVSTQPTKKKVNKGNAIFAAVILLAVAYLGRNDIANLFDDTDLFPEETPSAILNPADVHLYTFSDPYDNVSVNVEFWLINIGEEAATDIEMFIRARNHNGTILFSEVVDTTALLLRENETCSGMYIIEYGDAEYLTHTIEIEWSEGRNSYQKKTIIVGLHSTG